MSDETVRRKSDHIKISLNQNVQARNIKTGFEDVSFIHKTLPEIDRNRVDLSARVFGHRFSAPLIVGAITGGTEEAEKINATIAQAVEELGLGMGVGSQRAALENSRLEKSFAVARKKAPKAFLVANIGGVQLVNGYGLKEVKRAIDMIEADALAIHLNALQEIAQPEGQTNFQGILRRIRELTQELDQPVIVKETGAGIAAEEAKLLEDAGVKGIDMSGAGGTSFAAVECYRAGSGNTDLQHEPGAVFWDWGIPTAESIVEVSETVKIPVIASGGIRNGLDLAKSLALGASLGSLSQPILKSSVKGAKETVNALKTLTDELKNAMFLVGASSVEQLRKSNVVITGKTSERLRMRGFAPEKFARRHGVR